MRELLLLAWPIIISRSTQVVVGVADATMVTPLGEDAMAATTAGSLNSMAAFIFPMGIVFILSSFASQLAGRGDLASARRYGWYGLGVAVLSEVLILCGLPFLPRLLASFDYTPAVAAGLHAYLAVRLLSTGLVVGVEALGNYYGGLGNTQVGMRANICAMVSNVFFNWLLIYGHWGCPALGVRGAALGSVLASGVAFCVIFGTFLRDGRGLPRAALRWTEFRRVLRFGLPMGLNWAFEFYAFIAFINLVVASLGTSAIAAMMAVIQINSVSFMPAFGVASAGSILVGQAIGGGRKDAVPGLVRLTMKAVLIWMGLAGLGYLLMPALLLSPFVSPDTDGGFLRLGVRMLMLSACWQAFDGIGMTLTECLRAAGDTTFPMWARGLIAWGAFFPGSWYAVKNLGGGETAAMACLIAYLGLLAAALLLRFRGGAWRRIELISDGHIC